MLEGRSGAGSSVAAPDSGVRSGIFWAAMVIRKQGRPEGRQTRLSALVCEESSALAAEVNDRGSMHKPLEKSVDARARTRLRLCCCSIAAHSPLACPANGIEMGQGEQEGIQAKFLCQVLVVTT